MTITEDPPVPTNAVPTPDNNLNDNKPCGFGRMLRKEDPRFVRGLGKYCDDIELPGMLHLAILRSPMAHARIVSIDKSAAEAHPRVKAVITGADLAAQNLAWMPTLSNDVQAVLATDKVRFQHQEVAFVVAEDRYSARDALELIDVEYEWIDPVIDVRKALAPDAPVIRDDLEGKTNNHCFDWEAGDKDATEAVFADAEVVVSEDIVYPRSTLRPWRRAAAWPTSSVCRASSRCGARPRHRTPIARCTPSWPGCRNTRSGSSHRTSAGIRQQGADLSRLRLRHRRLARDRQAGEVDGGPHRESREHRFRPRLHHAR